MLVTALLLLGSGVTTFLSFLPSAAAQTASGTHLRVRRSDEQAILLELTVDGLGESQIETVESGGQTYHRLAIPDMAQTATPGHPQVPTRGALLGLPTTEGVSVQVLETHYETLGGYRLFPAPGLRVTGEDWDTPLAGSVAQIFTLDQDLYATNAFYPGSPAELDYTGYLREQAVAQVRFYPLQYNPVTGELRLYRRILARITWDTSLPAEATTTREAGPVFENLVRDVVLNYPPPPPLQGGGRRSALERHAVVDSQFGTRVGRISGSTAMLKIGVTEDGLYQLTYSDLMGAGLDLSGVDPRTVKITNRGTEIPIYVHGEDDGVFNTTDTVLFYGTGITDLYTSENVYWLTVGGGDGQRLGARDGTPSGGTVPAHFPVTLHAEQDTSYWQSMPNGAGQDHWFWGDRLNATATTRTCTSTLHNISTTASTTTVRVRLKGRTTISGINPDHHTRIYLNGYQVDDQQWDGQIIYDHAVTVSHSLLNEGNNVITVERVGDTGAVVDQFYVNWIEIDYWDTYMAEDDELLFGAPVTGTFQFEVTHFGGSDVQVFDVTDPASVTIITGTAVIADGGSYTLQFEDAAQPDARYLALTGARRKTPARIELDQPSLWESPTNGADYVIITHEDFYTSCLRLASHRDTASDLGVVTVKVGDVYDEFNDGIFSPQAIRDFLSYAYQSWDPAPTYVLLVGDATYDYKDNLNTGTVNYVPSQIIETDQLGQTPSDNWFVLVNGADILPDMLIGRLSAQEVSQVENIVDKIIQYEQNPPDGSWNEDVLLVADDDDSAFETTSEEIAGLLPDNYVTHKVYVGNYPPGDPTADITQYINSGSFLVNYVGHGHVDGWGQWNVSNNIFERSDITALNNTHKLPVVTVANCLNGFFTGSRTDVSAAETFLRLKDKGAVAVWASTGMGYASGHRVLMGEFYQAIFQGGKQVLGAATSAAKIAAYNQNSAWGELVQTFVLFGDPATPFNYPYVESTTPSDGASGVPVDREIQIVFNKPMSTTTVVLGGEGTLGLPFTPTWSAGDTVVTYAHPDFRGCSSGQTFTFTISGQDQFGSPLGFGVVPSTWSFTVSNDVYLPLVVRNG